VNLLKASRIFLVTALVAAGMALVAQAPAQAHTWSSHFTNGRWPVNATVNYGVNTGFPTGEWRSRLLDGKNQWNNATNSGEPSFYWGLQDDINHGTAGNPCGISGWNTAAVFWNDLDYIGGSILGATRLCNVSGTIANFTIEFDNDRSNWYTGTGDNPSSNHDAWSVATHEFGHAFGFWEHITESDGACPDSSSRATMCPSIYTGTERQRTLIDHDIHTFDAAH
jgi:hypothetical protein